jgi:cell division protein FtsN
MARPLHPEHETRDNRRAFRWGAIAVAVLIVLALGYNMISYERAGPLGPETSTQERATQQPRPTEGGASGGAASAAGPGTGAGTGTGAPTGAGAPAGTPRP